MTEKLKITVYRINESAYKNPTESIEATSVSVDDDGSSRHQADEHGGFRLAHGAALRLTECPVGGMPNRCHPDLKDRSAPLPRSSTLSIARIATGEEHDPGLRWQRQGCTPLD